MLEQFLCLWKIQPFTTQPEGNKEFPVVFQNGFHVLQNLRMSRKIQHANKSNFSLKLLLMEVTFQQIFAQQRERKLEKILILITLQTQIFGKQTTHKLRLVFPSHRSLLLILHKVGQPFCASHIFRL